MRDIHHGGDDYLKIFQDSKNVCPLIALGVVLHCHAAGQRIYFNVVHSLAVFECGFELVENVRLSAASR
jgi:hypothetical protein